MNAIIASPKSAQNEIAEKFQKIVAWQLRLCRVPIRNPALLFCHRAGSF